MKTSTVPEINAEDLPFPSFPSFTPPTFPPNWFSKTHSLRPFTTHNRFQSLTFPIQTHYVTPIPSYENPIKIESYEGLFFNKGQFLQEEINKIKRRLSSLNIFSVTNSYRNIRSLISPLFNFPVYPSEKKFITLSQIKTEIKNTGILAFLMVLINLDPNFIRTTLIPLLREEELSDAIISSSINYDTPEQLSEFINSLTDREGEQLFKAHVCVIKFSSIVTLIQKSLKNPNDSFNIFKIQGPNASYWIYVHAYDQTTNSFLIGDPLSGKGRFVSKEKLQEIFRDTSIRENAESSYYLNLSYLGYEGRI